MWMPIVSFNSPEDQSNFMKTILFWSRYTYHNSRAGLCCLLLAKVD